jgi:predicted DNA-binding transcriptional regulator YafY
VVERYPVAEQEERDGALFVRLAVTGEAWLRALLLRLGTAAEVLDPPAWRHLGADAADALLRRYEAAGS